ncbi:MAG TPA: energy transducer TonB, partial [Coleofasciculaceae cyanobacterium]
SLPNDIGIAPTASSPATPAVEPTPELPASPSAPAPSLQSPVPSPRSTPSQPQPSAFPPSPAPAPPSPVPSSPAPPLVRTFSIDTPLPDVSETLPPSPQTVDPSQLAQVNTSRQAEPVSLTASLQVVALPPEAGETPPPDAIAKPKDTVDGVSRHTFKADPKISPCVPDAAAAQSIGTGTTAAIQVITDAQGHVTETALHQSSLNPAYDDLAICLVKNWGYEPAIAQEQPVPSQSLMVLVRIDRSESVPEPQVGF